MVVAAMSTLAAWSTFYETIGSSSAALTGLVFIVITLVSGTERRRRNPDGIATFTTPTVLHFCMALFVALVALAPWHALTFIAVLTGLAGLYGMVHILRVFARARAFTQYTPDLDDWAWYTVLPFIAYSAIFGSAIALLPAPRQALFVLAGGVALLIFIGIRNAWDVVTFIAISDADATADASKGGKSDN
jgi:F0F1-type ATP synthase assembly protein I